MLSIQMGGNLSKPDLATRTYMLAATFELMRQRQEVVDAQKALHILIADLQTRINTTFALNEEQRVWFYFYLIY